MGCKSSKTGVVKVEETNDNNDQQKDDSVESGHHDVTLGTVLGVDTLGRIRESPV
uniref:Uncharacterized protein n=1 Tax=Arion vulgaris TaxID=1028688 RepID=A0A0B6XYP7_9EUPU